MKLLLAGAVALAAGPALSATVFLSGEALRADPFGGLEPFAIKFETAFDVEDSLIDGGSFGGGQEGLPVSVAGSITINDSTFDDGDIALQVFSNEVFGIRVNLASITDGTTDVTPGLDDFRLFGASFEGLTLLDATVAPRTIPFLDIAFFETGSDAPSQASVLGSFTLAIEGYGTPAIAPVSLPASMGFGMIGLAALGGLALFRR